MNALARPSLPDRVGPWVGLCFGILALAPTAQAHTSPNTSLLLRMETEHLSIDATVPCAELHYALPDLAERPSGALPASVRTAVIDYVGRHASVRGADGRPWVLRVDDASLSDEADHSDLRLSLTALPPSASAPGDFVLHWDLVTHVVMSHAVLVFVGAHTPDGSDEPRLLGSLQNPASDLPIRWDAPRPHGFAAAFWLGVRHIGTGMDHLLFLLTLVLSAPQAVAGVPGVATRRGATILRRLATLVTAFTVGHCISLVVATLFAVQLPARPVEVAVALTIVAGAIASARPAALPRRALFMLTAGFGLVHGLAFSAGLREVALSAGERVRALIGFNLGIEAVQLMLIAAITPALLKAAGRPAYGYIRVAGSAAAGTIAAAWAVQRLFGHSLN